MSVACIYVEQWAYLSILTLRCMVDVMKDVRRHISMPGFDILVPIVGEGLHPKLREKVYI